VIEASQFVEPAKQLGFDFWAGVPCSFLTPFINYTIGDSGLDYISSANEGDAVAVASGAALGGRRSVAMMQNSGLGNAVNPLTSLNYVFEIPLLLIISLRGEPGRPDEPQHELMGQITLQMLETMGIPWSWFPETAGDIGRVLQLADTHMNSMSKPYALVMRKGAVAPYSLKQESAVSKPESIQHGQLSEVPVNLPSRHDVLRALIDCTDEAETMLLASTGFAGRELYAIKDRTNQLYMVGSMGCASSLGLGLSIARADKKVIVIDGDGAALMRMGNLATAGAYGAGNFYHLLLDNGVHESTGGQATVSYNVDFPSIAAACGYRSIHQFQGNPDLAGFLSDEAPAFMHIQTNRGVPDGLPRPAIKPAEVAQRLMAHLQAKPA